MEKILTQNINKIELRMLGGSETWEKVWERGRDVSLSARECLALLVLAGFSGGNIRVKFSPPGRNKRIPGSAWTYRS